MKRLFLTAAALLISVNAAYADGENKIGKSAKIKKAEAETIALAKVPGTVVDADIEKRKTGLYWDIKIKPTGGKAGEKKKVRLDANTGAIVVVEDDSDNDGDDKDKKD